MIPFLLTLSVVVNIIFVVPYLRDIVKGKTKPRIVSWFNWTLLAGIGTAAAIAEQEYSSAVLTGASTAITTLVVLLGLKYGDRSFDRTDVLCQLGAIAGLLLWVVFDDPLLALLTTIGIDFLASIPTYKHAWQKPHEETVSAYIGGFLSAFLVLLTIREFTLVGLLYPVFILVSCLSLVLLLWFGPNVRKARGV